MKLEEVLPHLRAGGEVRTRGGFHSRYSLKDVLKLNESILESNDFQIVKEAYKSETTVHVSPEYDWCYHIKGESKSKSLRDLFPKVATKEVGYYKITIEEIEEC